MAVGFLVARTMTFSDCEITFDETTDYDKLFCEITAETDEAESEISDADSEISDADSESEISDEDEEPQSAELSSAEPSSFGNDIFESVNDMDTPPDTTLYETNESSYLDVASEKQLMDEFSKLEEKIEEESEQSEEISDEDEEISDEDEETVTSSTKTNPSRTGPFIKYTFELLKIESLKRFPNTPFSYALLKRYARTQPKEFFETAFPGSSPQELYHYCGNIGPYQMERPIARDDYYSLYLVFRFGLIAEKFRVLNYTAKHNEISPSELGIEQFKIQRYTESEDRLRAMPNAKLEKILLLPEQSLEKIEKFIEDVKSKCCETPGSLYEKELMHGIAGRALYKSFQFDSSMIEFFSERSAQKKNAREAWNRVRAGRVTKRGSV